MGKKQKLPVIIVGLTVIFLVFSIGFFAGRRTLSELTVATERPQAAAVQSAGVKRTVSPAAVTTAPQETAGDAGTATADARVNINTASVQALDALPGIGEVIAQRIVAYREEHGRFTDVTELTEVKGIGEKTLETLLNLITVG